MKIKLAQNKYIHYQTARLLRKLKKKHAQKKELN